MKVISVFHFPDKIGTSNCDMSSQALWKLYNNLQASIEGSEGIFVSYKYLYFIYSQKKKTIVFPCCSTH